MPRPSSAVLALALTITGCNRSEPPNVKPWVRPTPRDVADPSCAAIARATPNAAWQRAVVTFEIPDAGALALGDPSVLGGPFHAPIVVDDVPAGPHALDVLTAPGGPRPLCAVLHLRPGEATSWKQLGEVPVDTGVVAIVDRRRFDLALRRVAGGLVAGVQAEAGKLPSVMRELAAAGIPVELVLPTLATTTRPAQEGDRDAVRAALQRAKADGHYVEEPATTGWLFLRALGDHAFSHVDLPGAEGVGVAIEASETDSAYGVALGMPGEPGGAPVTVELRLSR